MANINQISPDGGTTVYDIEDPTARSGVNSLTPRVGIAEGKITTLQEQMLSVQNSLGGLGTASTKNSTSVVTSSSDLVESGAVKDAVESAYQLVEDAVGWTGKNELPITFDSLKSANTSGTWNGNVYSRGGRTFTVNADLSITVGEGSGEVSNTTFVLVPASQYTNNRRFKGCPSGGGVSSYLLRMRSTTSGDFNDTGYGVDFIPDASKSYIAEILVMSTADLTTAKTFEPMLYNTNLLDNSYSAPHASVEQTLRDAEVIEGKNLLYFKNSGFIGETTNVIASENDGIVTFTNNANSDSYYGIMVPLEFPQSGDYILSGCPSGGSTSTYFMYVQSSDLTETYRDTGSGVTCQLDSAKTYNCYIKLSTGYGNGKVFKPMLRKASETDPTFEPYYTPLKDVVPTKADNSVIAPVENGSTASQAYAVGEHFIKDGAFCTCKQAISQGGSFTLNTNYTAGDVADELDIIEITNSFCTNILEGYTLDSTSHVYKQGKHIFGDVVFNCSSVIASVDRNICTLTYRPRNEINSACFLGETQWDASEICYLYMNVYLTVKNLSSQTAKAVKIHLDYITA